MRRSRPGTITSASRNAMLCSLLMFAAFTSPWAAAHSAKDDAATPAATPADSPEASPGASHGERSDAGTGTGAAYMTVTNGGAESDRLLGGSADVAQIVEIHDMKIEGGVMRMIPLIDGLEVPGGQSVSLQPQGFHVMLIDLTRDLKPGEQFDLTLTFERAGDVVVPVVIGPAAPEGAAAVSAGEITIAGAWSRPAPMLSPGTGHDHGAATPNG